MSGFDPRVQTKTIIQQFVGQENTLVAPRILIEYMGGSLGAGVMLNQILYWSGRVPPGRDGWFYKTDAEWQDELFLSRRQVRRNVEDMRKRGILETKVRKKEGRPVLWYRLDWDVFEAAFVRFLERRNGRSGQSTVPNGTIHGLSQTGQSSYIDYGIESGAAGENAPAAPRSGANGKLPIDEQTGVCFLLKSGGKWELGRSKLDQWRAAYPRMDVAAELRKAQQWLADNPRRRKTARGMVRFLGDWLKRTQNDLDAAHPLTDAEREARRIDEYLAAETTEERVARTCAQVAEWDRQSLAEAAARGERPPDAPPDEEDLGRLRALVRARAQAGR